ncbi:MAG: hypothetical protein V9F82_07530 [Dermatophilaceae bacterium]
MMLEEAKKRDHRKLGQELELFMFSEKVGAGSAACGCPKARPCASAWKIS